MKKIVPFNNVLTFNTDVREITAISLEHDIKTEENAISGTFYITGEYKITDGQLDREKFSFDLPFDIALGCNYNLDTIVVDIDDFRYELIDRNQLKVNIDLYIDGEVVEQVEETEPISEKESEETAEKSNAEEELFTEEEIRAMKDDEEENDNNLETTKDIKDPIITKIDNNLDLLDEMLKNKEEEPMEETKTDINIENENNNDNNNINIFNGFNEEEQYVTYHVYPVTENDTLDKIMEKYNVTKEDLAKYNNIDDIHTGDKLIIPANNNDK